MGYFTLAVIKELNSNKNKISEKTKKLQQQMNLIIYVQVNIFLVFY